MSAREYILLSKACRQLGSPSPATIWRWTRKGCRGVKLQAWLIGGRWFTTQEAVDAFVVATTAAARGGDSQPTHAIPVNSQRSREQARAELSAAGI